jgi:hypothetical protein
MVTFNFITIRLGKDSIPDIQKICSSGVGALTNVFTINVKCTQVPDNYGIGDYAFLWLGSDNNKGMPTQWKQGFKAVGRVNGVLRGKNYNDTSETTVEIIYIFHEAVNRMDILRCAPVAYYWCSSMPLIGIDDHANQTIRNMSGSMFSDLRAFFTAIEAVTNRFRNDIIQIEPGFKQFFDVELPNPQFFPTVKNLTEISLNRLQLKRTTPLQQIFYGAPGTGKSHRIKEQLDALNIPKDNIFRTTFHPDSDFSTFVGAYKPTMKKQYRYDGKVKAKYYEDDDLADAKKDDIIIDNVIQYSFTPQAFVNAYVRAYQTDEKVYLIIEEINRGNCAQIFGDLFQLLDRDENGVSEYTIKADADIRAYLEEVLGKDAEGIKDGELCIPSNLYIYATMNTSDQSLFPIDSAFKRRWDWEYEPIKYQNTDWLIDINGNKYSWTSFQKEVNNRIFDATNSEDKMLGDFFVKPYDGIISEKLLLNKVLFYLWNDVCKDGDGDIFKTEDNKDVKFSDLYGENGTAMLLSMMKHLKVSHVSENVESVDDEESEENGRDNTKYSINGNGSYAKRTLSTELVKVYISQHPEMSATEVVNKWKSLGKFVSHFIETQDEYDIRTDQNPRVNVIQCNGDNIYVSTNGWGGQGVMDSLINAIPQDWNLNVEKV